MFSHGNGRGAKKRPAVKESAESKLRLHFRRCHLCDTVNECEGAVVDRCTHCGKIMAPFFFFNEEEVVLYSDRELRPQEKLGDRNPVRGLTAYW